MKKVLYLIWILFISIATVNAQWSQPIQIGINNIFYSLAAEDSTVHVAYGDGTIYYRNSTDEGTTWSSPVTIGSGSLYLDRPICVNRSNVYIVYFRDFNTVTDWCCSRNLSDIYMRRSTDGGVTWQPETQLTTSDAGYRVAIISSGSNVYLSWMDYRSGTTWDLYFRKSMDNGATWLPEVNLVPGTNSVGAERPDIIAQGDSIYLFWMSAVDNLPPCYTMPNCSEVYYKRSFDGGTSWGADTRLNTTNAYAARPISTVVPPGTIVTSWEGEDGTNHNEVYVLRSTDNGTTWDTAQQMSYIPSNNAGPGNADGGHQFVASGGPNVHVAWFDSRDSTNLEIHYRQSTDAGAIWSADENVSNAFGASKVPVLGTTNNYVHAIWGDDRGGSFAPWYSRRSVSINTSTPGISSGSGTEIIIYPNPAKTELNIQLNSKNYSEIEIINSFGQSVFKTQNQNKIDIANLCNGIYFLKVKQGTSYYSRKFIKF